MFLNLLKAPTTSINSSSLHNYISSPFLALTATKNYKKSEGSIPASKISVLKSSCFRYKELLIDKYL